MGFITTNYIGGGLLTERYGSKWVFGLAVFGSSALGFVLPVMASWGSGALLAVRIVQGVLQGGPIGLIVHCVLRYSEGRHWQRSISGENPVGPPFLYPGADNTELPQHLRDVDAAVGED